MDSKPLAEAQAAMIRPVKADLPYDGAGGYFGDNFVGGPLVITKPIRIIGLSEGAQYAPYRASIVDKTPPRRHHMSHMICVPIVISILN